MRCIVVRDKVIWNCPPLIGSDDAGDHHNSILNRGGARCYVMHNICAAVVLAAVKIDREDTLQLLIRAWCQSQERPGTAGPSRVPYDNSSGQGRPADGAR